jgi:hypothetical protein
MTAGRRPARGCAVQARNARATSFIGGAVAAVLGGFGTVDLLRPSDAPWAAGPWRALEWLGLPVGLLGMIAMSGALWRFARAWRIAVLVAGLLLLAIGVDPWLYTPALMHDRPNSESAGMTGFIIFLFVGLPGLLCVGVGIGLVLGGRKSRRGHESTQDSLPPVEALRSGESAPAAPPVLPAGQPPAPARGSRG